MRKILFLAFQFLILHVSATTYYVSTNGKPEETEGDDGQLEWK